MGEAVSPEADLLLRLQQKEATAWNLLVETHQQSVFRLAYLFVGDAQQAEDIAQETFVRAYLAFHRYDPARPLRPWLLSIAANLARNKLRSRSRYLGALTRLFQSAPAYQPPIEQASFERLESQALWQAVRRLDPNDQQVIYLRFFLELPVEETAQIMQVAPGTVKSRLSRALARLRTLIQKDFPALKDGSSYE